WASSPEGSEFCSRLFTDGRLLLPAGILRVQTWTRHHRQCKGGSRPRCAPRRFCCGRSRCQGDGSVIATGASPNHGVTSSRSRAESEPGYRTPTLCLVLLKLWSAK